MDAEQTAQRIASSLKGFKGIVSWETIERDLGYRLSWEDRERVRIYLRGKLPLSTEITVQWGITKIE